MSDSMTQEEVQELYKQLQAVYAKLSTPEHDEARNAMLREYLTRWEEATEHCIENETTETMESVLHEGTALYGMLCWVDRVHEKLSELDAIVRANQACVELVKGGIVGKQEAVLSFKALVRLRDSCMHRAAKLLQADKWTKEMQARNQIQQLAKAAVLHTLADGVHTESTDTKYTQCCLCGSPISDEQQRVMRSVGCVHLVCDSAYQDSMRGEA